MLGALLLLALALASDPPVLVDDGAWCWFADPRAVAHGGRTHVGWISSEGDVEVGAWDPETRSWEEATLRAGLERDDHDNPALWFDAEGRLHAFYSKHSNSPMWHRRTVAPGDLFAWTEERALELYGDRPGRRTTYPNPVEVPAEGRLYLLWRGDDWKPDLSWSEDGAATWTPARTVVAPAEPDPGNRPYVKVAPAGEAGFHLAFTDGHPRKEPANSIRYLRYEDGAMRRSDGTPLAKLDELPLETGAAEVVHDGSSELGRAWIWDVAEDAEGRPVIVYAALPARDDHRYRYARHDGEGWVTHPITAAGGWFPHTPEGAREGEPHYSGGVVLDHGDPRVVYLSREVDGRFEIERWRTEDGGASWTSEPLTRDSERDQVRPVAVRGPGERGCGERGPRVLWMSLERYRHYTDYRASLRADRR